MALFTDFFIALFGTGYYATKYAVSKGKGYAYDEEIQKEIREKRVKEQHEENIRNAKSFCSNPKNYENYESKMKGTHYVQESFDSVNIIETKRFETDSGVHSIIYAIGRNYDRDGRCCSSTYYLGSWLNDFSISYEDFLKKILLSLKERSKVKNIDFIQSDIAPKSNRIAKKIYPDAKFIINVEGLMSQDEWRITADYKEFYNGCRKAFTRKESKKCVELMTDLIAKWSWHQVIATKWQPYEDEIKYVLNLNFEERRKAMMCVGTESLRKEGPLCLGGCLNFITKYWHKAEGILIYIDSCLEEILGTHSIRPAAYLADVGYKVI